MPHEHFVIIGNGPAGNEAARTISREATGARITLISRSYEACYRKKLLPHLIAGRVEENALPVCTLPSYKDEGIKLRCGQRVVELNPQEKGLILDHKELVRFSGLIIAVGGRPHIPEFLKDYREFFFTLTSIRDVNVWKENVMPTHDILIIGGDLTSFAMTDALLSMNKKVYFLLDKNALWPVRATEALLNEVRYRLEQKGVTVLNASTIKEITRVSRQVLKVVMDGPEKTTMVEVGMVGAFFGRVPDIEFLNGSGLPIDRGILVDEYLNTGFENVFAAGDCAQVYHPEIHDYWVSVGHDNAVELGRTAALNLIGGNVKARVKRKSIYEVQGVKVNTSWWMEY